MNNKEKKTIHIEGRYLIIVALIGFLGTLITVYKDEIDIIDNPTTPKVIQNESNEETTNFNGDNDIMHTSKTQPISNRERKEYTLSIVVNEGDLVRVFGESEIFENPNTSAIVRKYQLLEGMEYEVLISGCPTRNVKITNNERINRCQ